MRHGAALFEPVDNEGCPKVVIENDGKYTTLIVDGINLCQGCKSIEFKHTAGESAILTVAWETEEICFCNKKKAPDAATSEKIADPVVQVQSQRGMGITSPLDCMTEAVRTAIDGIAEAEK